MNLSWTTLQVNSYNDYLSDLVTRFQDTGELVVDDVAGGRGGELRLYRVARHRHVRLEQHRQQLRDVH